jgi:hypothetical protein
MESLGLYSKTQVGIGRNAPTTKKAQAKLDSQSIVKQTEDLNDLNLRPNTQNKKNSCLIKEFKLLNYLIVRSPTLPGTLGTIIFFSAVNIPAR